jgi:DNA-binding response OmpR family regulator
MSISLLIAEPDRTLRSTLTEFFAADGFYVQSVSSQETLENRLSDNPPAVLLLETELLDGDLLAGVSPVRTVVLTRHMKWPIPLPACLAVAATFSKPAVLRDVSAAIRMAAQASAQPETEVS